MTHRSTEIPERILYQYKRANMLYPQMNAGVSVLVGSAALRMVVSGQATWQHLTEVQASAHQSRELVALADKVHHSSHIPFNLEELFSGSAVARVGLLATGFRRRTTNVSGSFAAATIPRAVPRVPRGYSDELPMPETKEAARVLLTRRLGFIRPEAVALSGVYDAASTALNSKTCLSAARQYRSELAGLCVGGDRLATDSYIPLLRDLLNTMKPAVVTAIGEALPQIEAYTGISVPDHLVDKFVGQTEVDPYVVLAGVEGRPLVLL
jgi:hypothetical protein